VARLGCLQGHGSVAANRSLVRTIGATIVSASRARRTPRTINSCAAHIGYVTRSETSFLRGTRIENLERSTWRMWATRYERPFTGVFAMTTNKTKRDAARYYQSWHPDTPYGEALRAVSLTDRQAICPDCEEPIESYHVVDYQYDGVPKHAHCRVCDEAINIDEPKHNIRADARWAHVDCPSIPPGPRWYEKVQAWRLQECAQQGHVPVSVSGGPADRRKCDRCGLPLEESDGH